MLRVFKNFFFFLEGSSVTQDCFCMRARNGACFGVYFVFLFGLYLKCFSLNYVGRVAVIVIGE